MNNARNLLLFVAAIAGGFVYICNAIPQIESQPVEEVTIGSSPEELVAAGDKIFNSDRAQCLTCHSLREDPKARCPNQEGLGKKLADKERPGNAADYLVESVYNPNAYIVSGYPAKQMTPVNKPPIVLSDDEILAVIAFLNALGGKTDEAFIEQVKAAQGNPDLTTVVEREQEAKLPILLGEEDAGRGATLFRKSKIPCINCHKLGDEGTEVGPDLSGIGSQQGAEYLMESILTPDDVIVKGYDGIVIQMKDGTLIDGVKTAEDQKNLYVGVQDPEQYKGKFAINQEGYLVLPIGEIQNATLTTGTENDHAHTVNVPTGLESISSLNKRTSRFTDESGKRHLHGIENGVVEQAGGHTHTLDNGDFVLGKPQTKSPMPDNISENLTAREFYDIITYLLSLKGGGKL